MKYNFVKNLYNHKIFYTILINLKKQLKQVLDSEKSINIFITRILLINYTFIHSTFTQSFHPILYFNVSSSAINYYINIDQPLR